jgi:hypothetical protein
MRTASLFGENLLLTREFVSRAESGDIEICDTIENQGSADYEYMLLYHINFGFPLVSPDSTVHTNHARVYFLESSAVPEADKYRHFTGPQKTFSELTFELHDPEAPWIRAQVENPRLGLRAGVGCSADELPCFTEWINLAEQDYVLGLEPGTHYPVGRTKAALTRGLESLHPGEKKRYGLNISLEAF